MPNMPGIQLAKKISEDKAKAMGIRGYVMNSVVKSELADKIREVLDEM